MRLWNLGCSVHESNRKNLLWEVRQGKLGFTVLTKTRSCTCVVRLFPSYLYSRAPRRHKVSVMAALSLGMSHVDMIDFFVENGLPDLAPRILDDSVIGDTLIDAKSTPARAAACYRLNSRIAAAHLR